MITKRENSESRAELVRAMPSREGGRALLKDSIETAYSFLHQKRNVFIHSTLDWQKTAIKREQSQARLNSAEREQFRPKVKDDIELAIGSYVDDMSQVIGLPLRSSKNSMRPYPTAELIS